MNPVLVENPVYDTHDTRDTFPDSNSFRLPELVERGAGNDATYYPEEDGEPMAETERHLRSTFYAVGSLDNFFEDNPMMYICGNMFIYLEEGNPNNVVSPDVFAVPGISKHERRVYKLWIEKKPPAFVLEIISRSTAKQDEGEKRDIYQAIGVQELFLHDPDEDYMKPGLVGWRLNQHGVYVPIRPRFLRGNILCLESHVLGLELRLKAGTKRMRFFNPASGEYLRSHKEEAEERKREAEKRKREAEKRKLAEERIKQLEAQLAQLQSGKSGNGTNGA